ncbi:tetratricopeptide repeat protein [Arcobacter sp. FWKO B]|uniref:tetratricopeptide repeat protein n=1 Tax=Arcobacter sp. FWKO B TaxID=2593672 RepID=UPI0018A3DE66|nr:hypothetical protein [Arcobacter sp. FWKO B]QOG13055.1 hypothetical protein FWKOB_10315 [Arcobacter sp. FWKO B]
MHSYKSLVLALLIPFIFAACATKEYSSSAKGSITQIDQKVFDGEDMYILFALEALNQQDHLNAFELFVILYNSTYKYEYLQRAISIALVNQEYPVIIDLVESNIKRHKEHLDDLNFIYSVSLMNVNRLDEALVVALSLLNKDSSVKHLILTGNIYFFQNEYDKSLSYFMQAYDIQKENTALLLVISDILFYNLEQKDEAIKLLDNFITENGCQINICEKIYLYYMEQNDIDGMISTLEKNYKLMLSLNNIDQMYKTLNVMIEMIKLKDINKAIEFVQSLDDNEYKIIKLIELYKLDSNLEKLLETMQILYDKTNNIDVLAQMAIFQFELSEDKKSVLKSVISKFEKVLKVSTNHMYQNYLGYLLIDYDIDYKKGLKLVKMALEQDGENIAYLDSLAWGYYKLGDCDSAYKYMFDIVNKIGLENEEIKLHWEAIKNCKE